MADKGRRPYPRPQKKLAFKLAGSIITATALIFLS